MAFVIRTKFQASVRSIGKRWEKKKKEVKNSDWSANDSHRHCLCSEWSFALFRRHILICNRLFSSFMQCQHNRKTSLRLLESFAIEATRANIRKHPITFHRRAHPMKHRRQQQHRRWSARRAARKTRIERIQLVFPPRRMATASTAFWIILNIHCIRWITRTSARIITIITLIIMEIVRQQEQRQRIRSVREGKRIETGH